MKKIVLLLSLLFLCIRFEFAQTVYYVDDSNRTPPYNGQTPEDAWPDFSYFNINILGPNIEIRVLPGNYFGGNYNIGGRLATIGIFSISNVTIRKYIPIGTPDDPVRLYGNNGQIDWGIIVKNGTTPVSNITFQGLEFLQYEEDGIFLEGGDDEITENLTLNNVAIKNCKVETIIGNTNAEVSSAALKIQRVNTVNIFQCSLTLNNLNNNPYQYDGIYIDNSKNILLDSNIISLVNNLPIPIPPLQGPHIDCIQVTKGGTGSGCTNITIERNTVKYEGSYTGQGVYILYTYGEVLIRNNIISVSEGRAVHLYLEPGVNNYYRVFNNTISGGNFSDFHLTEFDNSDHGDIGRLIIKNNILYSGSVTMLDAIKFKSILPSEIETYVNTLDNNLFSNNNMNIIFEPGVPFNWDDIRWKRSNLSGDPLFNIPLDYTLQYESPAKNLGIAFPEINEDLFTNPRPYWGDDYDAGAFEIEDSQLKIGIISNNIIPSVTHTLTAFGTYWERNSQGNYPISTDESLESWSLTTNEYIIGEHESYLWEYPGAEYKWMDRGVSEEIGAGLYMLTSHITGSSFDDTVYLDLRDAVSEYSLNLYIQLDLRNTPSFRFFTGTGFDPINSADVIRIWDANKHQVTTTTGGLQNYWVHALAPVSKSIANEFHPLLVWGPYPDQGILNGNLQEFIVYRSIEHIPGTPPSSFPPYQTIAKDQFEYCDQWVSIGNDVNARDYKISALIQFPSEGTGEYFTNISEYRLLRPDKAEIYSEQNSLDFQLEQNYPNPFNPSTIIVFSLPKNEYINLKVFDVLGREVVKLIDGKLDAGVHKVKFDGKYLSSGIYFYSLSSANYTRVKKMQLIK